MSGLALPSHHPWLLIRKVLRRAGSPLQNSSYNRLAPSLSVELSGHVMTAGIGPAGGLLFVSGLETMSPLRFEGIQHSTRNVMPVVDMAGWEGLRHMRDKHNRVICMPYGLELMALFKFSIPVCSRLWSGRGE